MKTKIKEKTGIITTPPEYVSLELIENGFFRYLLTFVADPALALRERASVVKIYVTEFPQTTITIPVFNTSTPAFADSSNIQLNSNKAITQILAKNALMKDIIRSNQSNVLLSINSDITSKVPNDAAQRIANASSHTEPVNLFKVRKFVSVPVSQLTSQNIKPPVFEQNLQHNQNETVSSATIKQLSIDLLHKKHQDPASLIKKQNGILQTSKSFGGIYQKLVKPKIDDAFRSLITVQAPPTENTLNAFATITLPATANVSKVTLSEYIDIPFGAITTNDFYFTLELLDSNGLVVERVSKIVHHSKLVSILEIPKVPPLLNVLPVGKVGKNFLEIKQIDSNAIGISLYRKIVTKSTQTYDAGYTFIGKFDLGVSDGVKKIEDSIGNMNPCIYRAISYGVNNTLASEFSSAVSKPVQTKIKKISFERRINFVPMFYEISNSGITIELKDVPSGPVSIEVYKKDLFKRDDKMFLVDKPIQLNGQGNSSLLFKDSNVLKGRIYYYFYRLIYKDGKIEEGSNTLTIEYNPETSNIVDTRILNPRVVETGNLLDVQFELDSSFVLKTEDAIKSTLESQGLSQFFNTNLTKENLQSLIAYSVVRSNLTTGQIEDFGIITSNNFSDVQFASIQGVKPVSPGFEYTYTVSTYFRSATTLLENFTQTVIDSKFPSKNYTYKPFEWLHPVTLTEGNIITQGSLKTHHAKSQFSFGNIGKITKVTLSLSDILPTVIDTKATKINSKLIKIQWKVQGTVTKIDHFIITLEMLGIRSTIGKCHNISDSNYFESFDELTNDETGSLTYIITPVYYDYSRGKEVKTNIILI